ncbi:MAG: UvrD-helicase domain-containing protein [Myxococcota bacterium]
MDLSHLNPSQRSAVECIDGPLLVLAGAGSGKTRVITHRMQNLIELGVPADRIVGVTFTNKAAGEMRERLGGMVGHQLANEVLLATFHSLGARLLRLDPNGFGLPSSRFSILDQGDVFGIVRSLMREFGHHGAGGDRRFDIPAITQRISLWKNAFVPFEEEAVERLIIDEYDVVAASIYPAYEDRLRTLGAVDFDDLVCLVARTLAENPDVRAKWQHSFDYIMVDEYQDTNDAQLEFLRQLSRPPHNLCVVGDDDQAIYGWRGAKVENILRFDQMFANTKVVKLEENYRCRAPILHCANEVVANNKTRHDKTLIATRGEGKRVQMVVAGDGPQESTWVGKKIHDLIVEDGVSPNDIAVLYRSALQAKSIEEELQQHGIHYRVLGGQSVYDKKEVKDVMAYLKTMLTPRDELAVRRALETPPRGIGRVSMTRLSAYARENKVSMLEAVHRADRVEGIPSRAREGLDRFSRMIKSAQIRAREHRDAAAALEYVLDTINFHDHVRKEIGNEEAAAARLKGVDWLKGSIARYEARMRQQEKKPRWSEYFGMVTLDSSDDKDKEKEAEAKRKGQVSLATMHSCKGLEWDYVFIIGIEEGVLPHRRVSSPRASDAIAGDVEEERRLFYVGITRAREVLWLCRSTHRVDRGKTVPREPSRFIEELPEDGIEVYDISSEEELTSDAIGDMAAAFLSQIKPPGDDE